MTPRPPPGFQIIPSLNQVPEPPPGFTLLPDNPEDAAASIDVAAPVAEVRKAIGDLPEDQRQKAWDRYADTYIDKERAAGYRPAPNAGKSALFGLGEFVDEASAGIEAIPNLVTGGAVGPSYDEALAIQRARERAAVADSPTLDTVNRLAVGAMGPAGILKAGGTVLGNVARGAAGGAGIGAVSGFAAGEGGAEERLSTAGDGAKFGATVGAVLPVGIAGVQRGVGMVRDAVAPALARVTSGPAAAADVVLANKMKSAGITPQDVIDDLRGGREAARFKNSSATLPETIADTSHGMQRLTGSVYRAGGEAGDDVKGFLDARQRGPANRFDPKPGEMRGQLGDIEDAVARSMSVKSAKSAYRTEQDIIDKARTEANKLYTAAYKNSEDFDLQPAIDAMAMKMRDYPPLFAQKMQTAVDLFTRPVKAGGWAAEDAARLGITRLGEDMDLALSRAKTPQQAAKVREDYTIKLRRAGEDLQTLEQANRIFSAKRAPVSNVTTFDAAKKALDDMIEASKETGRSTNLTRELTDFKNALLRSVHAPNAQGVPTRNLDYQKARDEFGSNAEAREAIDLGRRALRENTDVTVDQFRALSPGQKKLARIGLMDAIRARNAGKKPGDNAALTLQDRRVTEILNELVPGKQAGRLGEYLRRQERMAETRGVAIGGSPTARNLEDDAETAAQTLGTMWNRWRSAPGVVNMGLEAVSSLASKVFGYNQAVAKELAIRLLATKPAEQRYYLNRLRAQFGPSKFAEFSSSVGQLGSSLTQYGAAENARSAADHPTPQMEDPTDNAASRGGVSSSGLMINPVLLAQRAVDAWNNTSQPIREETRGNIAPLAQYEDGSYNLAVPEITGIPAFNRMREMGPEGDQEELARESMNAAGAAATGGGLAMTSAGRGVPDGAVGAFGGRLFGRGKTPEAELAAVKKEIADLGALYAELTGGRSLPPEPHAPPGTPIDEVLAGELQRLERYKALVGQQQNRPRGQSLIPRVSDRSGERDAMLHSLEHNPTTKAIPGRQGAPSVDEQRKLIDRYYQRPSEPLPEGPWGRDPLQYQDVVRTQWEHEAAQAKAKFEQRRNEIVELNRAKEVAEAKGLNSEVEQLRGRLLVANESAFYWQRRFNEVLDYLEGRKKYDR